ncbi:putative histidine kinase M3YPp [Mollisia scopiformis]|uniref:Putative histidine kinase M3YPp n=1 Tax=Mollisia scopiformis TaxID=149040 RepID=A0A194XFS3_MOLSC|nr:putative histidine kinase M3YPp [Mollisia scopiformis]KUJ18979.1 putative histidine kinase M3YPp [Mollisia scopiformis]
MQFVLDFDWESTELGAVDSWSPELRRMANILMTDPRPAAMYWGKKRTMLYNEPYVVVTGQRHPGMMGKTFSEAWAEVAGDFISAFDTAYETGKAYVVDDARFYIQRHGYLEETYYSLSIIPFSLERGVVGFYNPVFDTTRQVIADRRMAFLLRLGQFIASSREPKDFWQQLLLGLQADHLDLPFGILYSAGGDINETLSESSEQSQNLKNWALEGLVRVPETCPSIPTRITTEREMEDFLPDFYDLIRSESATLLTTEEGTLPPWMTKEIRVNNGEHACESAIFLPIRSTADNILGFLMLGVNPRKRFDDDYKVFIELLSRQLATSMASAVLFEEEIRRGRVAAEQAAQDRTLLSKRLAIQTHEALETETRFRRMADLAPVGMFHIDPTGILVYANNDYYTMTGHPRDVHYPMSWYNVIAEIDHPVMDKEWAKLLAGEPVNFELRLRPQFVADDLVAGEKVEGSTWIIAAAYPEQAEDGTVTGILGCLTDISRQKWMEGFRTRKMLEAVELKRQQENFIDMTSHEMRNPLSAIIQCADYIATSLSEFEGDSKNVTLPREVADGYADAAQTVVLCAQHQKRIIDDILTLSKLDSDLLLITPIEVQPISVVQSALKMFDSEVQKSDMELRFRVDPSYNTLAVDWVKLDPSRLLQVLINLTTNAIKFTQSGPNRKITVNMAASTEHPLDKHGIQYLPRSANRKDLSLGSAWGSGEMVYLYIEVQDSGRGLDDQERQALFKRFSQASPRTHVQYGGSGLGLFISRELTELQGGQIGVSSQAGVGSTFAFFIRARRCNPPETPQPIIAAHSIDMKAQSKIISPAALARIQSGGGPAPLSERKAPQMPVAPKHVLIVEDNIVNQKVLSKQLRSAGCIVHVANHGLEALSFLSITRYWTGLESSGTELSIVLMDLEMPVMDGLTCVKEIRKLQQEGKIVGHIPVIAVTANARSEQISMAKEAGMDSVVTKPFRIPELLPEMERQVRRAGERAEDRPGDLLRSASAPPF